MKLLESWLPAEGSGRPLGCLATSFTFNSDFFAEDCLSRFLGISTRDPEGAGGLDIAGLLEEEEKLAETSVCVLVDQSCRPEPRNLRWDLIPVRVLGGLLHAKVALLIWENGLRVIIGSANLTPAGYRNQVEMALALDLDAQCQVPRHVFEELARELRAIVQLANATPGHGPHARAEALITLFEQRLAVAPLPASPPSGWKFALGVSRPGTSPFDSFAQVWSGTPPQEMRVLSPFWDDRDDMPGVQAALERLAKRASTGSRTTVNFIVPVDHTAAGMLVRAPARLRSVAGRRVKARVTAFDAGDGRRLHAKCLQYGSANWVATLFGSSNITGKGLGIDRLPHREINLWVGCRNGSPGAKAMATLLKPGDEIGEGVSWEPDPDDEDEALLPPLPAGFGPALMVCTEPPTLSFHLSSTQLPQTWEIDLPIDGGKGRRIMDSRSWEAAGKPESCEVQCATDGVGLPSVLEVRWNDADGPRMAPWLVNLGDGVSLPAAAELRQLPTEILLAVLASTRPLRGAIEVALRQRTSAANDPRDDLDPLKRFDASGMLLMRVQRMSAALWGVSSRLAKPLPNLEALEWRLTGILGPEHLARKLVEEEGSDARLPGETLFFLAELALVLSTVRWQLGSGVSEDAVKARVARTVALIRDLSKSVTGDDTPMAMVGYTEKVWTAAQT